MWTVAVPAPEFWGANGWQEIFQGGQKLLLCAFFAPFELKIPLKEYYDIVDEARPLSAFFPKHADSFTEMHF